jgi:alpha-mannosidase
VLRLTPGVARLDATVSVETEARDHRLRLLFPIGAPGESCRAASTFGIATRRAGAPAGSAWVHPAPSTFVQQGWVAAGGLMIVAPGLPEAELTADGVLAITLRRAVGWLARYDLRTRPIPAGPPMETPGAQLPGRVDARFALLAGVDPVLARDAELGLWGVLGGPSPSFPSGAGLLSLEPRTLALSALKPADDGDGIVVRVMNSGSQTTRARLGLGFPIAGVAMVRLDETATAEPVSMAGHDVEFDVPAHALRSVRLR